MTRVAIVGEAYLADLSIGGGPIMPGPQPPGYPSHPWVPPPPYPDQGLPPIPPGYWGGVAPPWPTHPIAPGGPPPRPTHPIAPGGRPPGIWGGPPLYPDQGLPGPQPTPTPPIYLPPGTIPGVKPEHPIYIPPSIWPNPGVPTHPIALPPEGSGEKPEVLVNWDVTTVWSPQSGWISAIVPSEEHPGVPTPSV
jgi:hypothetical protein